VKKILAVLILVLSTAACDGWKIPIAGDRWSGPTNPQPNQDTAAHIVWNLVYGLADGTEPPVLWHFNDSCKDSNGAWGPEYGNLVGAFKDPHVSACLFGQYESSGWVEPTEFDATDRIDIERNSALFSWQQVFAHELCHAMRDWTTDDGGDGDHVSECFTHDGVPYQNGNAAPGSLVDIANQALIAVGL
jgi:hypothetical protein